MDVSDNATIQSSQRRVSHVCQQDAADPTCVDMMIIIQPPHGSSPFSPDEEVAPRAWAGLAVVAAASFVATAFSQLRASIEGLWT
jgi:hypothetical protein